MNFADDPEVLEHLKRLETALFNTYDLKDVVRYLEEKTYLKGDRFSFKDHEFQGEILSDVSKTVYVQKCAQIGMSEAMARYALAVARIMPYFSVILTMPFSNDSSNFSKTRLTPIIDESPDLRNSIDKDLDNSEIKGVGSSLIYTRGCSSITSAISVPADMLIHDEVDRSDPDALGQYQSRIKHSQFKLTREFGTPTLEGVGIALRMKTAKRMRRACTCNHCGTTFVPNFHEHVKIPDFEGSFKEITKYNIVNLRWREARLHCPGCDGEPSLQIEHRKWICENPQDSYEAIGYFVTPFDVPNVVTIPSLVMEITKYKTWTEFVNQALGETANSDDSQISEHDMVLAKYEDGSLFGSEMHHMGIDVGQTCHAVVGRMTQGGELLVVHKERIPLAKLKERKNELKREYRVLMTVIDAFPETNTVHEMQKADKNLYGGVYHDNRKLATYEIVMVDKDLKEGKLPINQARIIRDLNFDEIMALLKARQLLWQPTRLDDDDLFAKHFTDMKRKEIFNKSQQLVYTWAKSRDGQDHYMHATGYLHVACRLAPTASKNMSFGGFPLVHKLQMTEKKSVEQQRLEARMKISRVGITGLRVR